MQLCPYGVNYQWATPELLVAGVVLRGGDYPPTPARQKMLRAVGKDAIRKDHLEQVVERARENIAREEADLRARKDAVIAEYRRGKGYQEDLLDLLRPELERTLGQVHDYKQFVQQVVQNVDVLLDKRYPNVPLEEKLGRASHEEAAIYWAARLMDEKIDAALLLMYPQRITAEAEQRRFSFHGLVTKYRKIYQRRIEAKGLKYHEVGDCWSQLVANPRAVAIIPHAIIDNAIKYAPPKSTLRLGFDERDDAILFSVESFGPVIESDESERIFELFFRGRHAAERDGEGTGFGLGSAQTIAKHLGTEIAVNQLSDRGPEGTRKTIFSVRFALPAKRAPASERAR